MSSDGYFEDEVFDDAALHEIDAIEVAHTQKPVSPDAAFDDMTFGEIDAGELERLDTFIEDSYAGAAWNASGPSRSSSSSGLVQTTLFGGIVPQDQAAPSRVPYQRKPSSHAPFGRPPPKTKKWDHTVFAKSGVYSGKRKGKDKADDEDEDEELVEFEQFPAPFVSVGPPPPMVLKANLLEAKHWIYPLNRPKRDYQYNIAKRCLFDNTIVALPTGLGKTFIAGVVMLNFYRWFPEGKVVFCAPTRPLVAQQIEASHQVCGIPGSDAAELTGQNSPSIRGRAWEEKRVFYMTPQTLINDLISGNFDPSKMILLVIGQLSPRPHLQILTRTEDEAHRATGDYAYCQIVRFMMAKNPHLRILALTATPGSEPKAVQDIVDGLHISHIEIRDEKSLDLRQYIFEKKIESHIIRMNDDINRVKDLLIKVMLPFIRTVEQKGLLFCGSNPVKISASMLRLKARQLKQPEQWISSHMYKLAMLAQAMGYLYEGSMAMCYDTLKGKPPPEDDQEPSIKKRKSVPKGKKLEDEQTYKALLQEIEAQRSRGFTPHPKMDRLKTLLVDYFGKQLGENGEAASDSRAIIFSTYRGAVDEIVDLLGQEQPLIRPFKFVGQGQDTKGNKGLPQKEQLAVIEKFKQGVYNVIVSTSIGEEGLDIGEVDLIVCYDTTKGPIRMLQRLGRTGRKRSGAVHLLLAEIREEQNMEKATAAYKEIQKTIVRGADLELYGDVERLLPDHVRPECHEQVMPIEEYVREAGRKKGSGGTKAAAGSKRKRNDDALRNVPAGASTGFVSVADLVTKGSKGKKQKLAPVTVKDFEAAGEDDEVDIALASGLIGALSRRSASAGHQAQEEKEAEDVPLTSSQFEARGKDDEMDVLIERGGSTSILSSPVDGKVIDIESDSPSAPQDMSWLLDGDSEPEPMLEIVDSSPIRRRSTSPVVLVEESKKAAGKRRQVDPDDSVVIIEPPPTSIKPNMPPPALPARILLDVSSPVPESPPAPTFPVRRAGRRIARMIDSPSAADPESPLVRRLHKKKSPRRRPPTRLNLDHGIYDMEAAHSGDEVSGGSSGSDDPESESDRNFLQELPETQMSASYDQSLVYRESLMTQLPGRPGLQFSRPVARKGLFGDGLSESLRVNDRRAVQISSSPPREQASDDLYEFGSFVVQDDEDIVYETDVERSR
ncbi:unnamed protein product [Mycena citricolor]|uniref:ATP-dependent DNA helicase n=1 Tax=Mycena citricolor TaxID=2018698 RepID=A0AAD2HS64_9AGAR|nr:unnamed protein product [Mycena citricolor]